MTIHLREAASPAGPVFTVTRNGGVSHTALASGSSASALSALAPIVNRNAERLQPDAMVEQVRDDAVAAVHALGADVKAGIVEQRDIARIRQATMAIPPNLPTEKFSEIRERLDRLDLPALAQRALSGDVIELAAQIDGGRDLSPHDDTTWAIVEERAAKAFHVARSGLQANYALKPSPDRLIQSGPDTAAAEQAADEAFQRLVEREDALEAREASLQSVLTVLAVLQHKTREQVLSEALA